MHSNDQLRADGRERFFGFRCLNCGAPIRLLGDASGLQLSDFRDSSITVHMFCWECSSPGTYVCSDVRQYEFPATGRTNH
jgi:hypothetical protein